MRLSGRKIILGVTGSIAAYKAVVLLRLLQQEGAEIKVAMTASAKQFVTPLTFATLARTPVDEDVWDDHATWSQHVQLGHWADLYVVAPATANSLAKFASGLCDDAVSALYLSAACPVLIAPAMDREMLAHPATQTNLRTLEARGHHLAMPASGYLASGLEGAGRLEEPEALLERIVTLLGPSQPANPMNGPLVGRRVLISAGPTQEPLDPVRYLTNHSSGKMGLALAEAALERGAEVTLVLGPTALTVRQHPRLSVQHITTALELDGAMQAAAPTHALVIMAAAVADYRPKTTAPQKLKKFNGRRSVQKLDLVENPDILAGLGKRRRKGQVLVGFALETENGLENARHKLTKKGADVIVLNTVSATTAFGVDTNAVTLVSRTGEPVELPLASKAEVAGGILDYLTPLLPSVQA